MQSSSRSSRGAVKIGDDQPAAAVLEELKQIQGLFEKLTPLATGTSSAESTVAAAEFLLEGMYAHKRLSRSEERGFAAQEKPARKPERPDREREYEEYLERRSRRGGLN